MTYNPNKTLLRDRKRWRIRRTEMHTKDRNSAGTDEKV